MELKYAKPNIEKDIDCIKCNAIHKLEKSKDNQKIYRTLKWICAGTAINLAAIRIYTNITTGRSEFFDSIGEGIAVAAAFIYDHYENKNKDNINDAENRLARIGWGVEYQQECRERGIPVDKSKLEAIVNGPWFP